MLIDNDKNKIVDQVNLNAKISYNNILLYDILAEDSKNSKDIILKMINSCSVCAKQDTKKTDADNAATCDKPDTNNDKADTNNNNNNKPDTEVEDKPDTKKKDAKKKDDKKKDSKPNTKVQDKPDTMKKDAKKNDSKPDTKVKDELDTKVKDNPDTKVEDHADTKVKDEIDTKVKDNANTKVEDNPDTKVKDKEDIESSASKNEPQKTLSNGEPVKTLDCIKKILKCFVCKKFINEKFRLRGQNKDGITLCSIIKPDKDFKIIHGIAIYRDEISLITEKKKKNGMKHNNSIYLEDKQIILKTSQTEDINGSQKNLMYQYWYILIKPSAIIDDNK